MKTNPEISTRHDGKKVIYTASPEKVTLEELILHARRHTGGNETWEVVLEDADDSKQEACAALAARIPFRMTAHMTGDQVHYGRYTCETLGIGHEYQHPAEDGYVKTGPKVEVKKFFFREDLQDAPCYPTLRELLEADDELRERAEAAYPANAEVSHPGKQQ